ncbi:MAG: hypothetical protein ACF788_09005 [Novipirellula sp. JB048]
MSVPKDILDSLLSAYMDDALSADERTRVEQLLHDDASVARELEQLQQIRQTLQQIRDQDRDLRLPADFAQTVIEATVARGRAEGLCEDHPVMRLSEQPSPMVTRPRTSWWRVATPLAAIAASLAIAFLATRPDPQEVRIAARDTAAPDEAREHADGAAIEPATRPAAPQVAASHADEAMRPAAPTNLDRAPSTTESIAAAPKSASAPSNAGGTANEAGPRKVAMARSAPPPPESAARSAATPPETPAAAEVVAIKAILVLDVHRTMDGRATRAVQSAMEAAGVDVANRKAIDENMVRFATENSDALPSDPAEGDTPSVLYLEAPAKRLDQFILRLIADEQGIESVQMTIANDPPLVGMLESLREVDPTTVTHGSSWQLDAGAEATRALASHLRDQPFVRLDRASASMAVTGSGEVGSASEGTDIVGRVLMIVR